MKKLIAVLIAAVALTGCANMPKRECTAIYEYSGMQYSVSIFGVKRVADRTLVKAGYPFNFQWVSIDNFKNADCSL